MLIHFGDLHVWRLGWDSEYYIKRFFGLANLLLRRGRKFPQALAESVLARLAAEEADYVLFSGDLTTLSLREEFRVGRRLFGPILDRWGERFIAIPGNHDRYTPRAVRDRLFETLFVDNPPRTYPFAVDLNGRWTLVGFDCSEACPLASRGRLGPEGRAQVDAFLETQQQRGRRLIVMGHYPLVYLPGRISKWDHRFSDRDEVLAMLQARGVTAYLHGHYHYRSRIETSGLTHLNCGSSGLDGAVPQRRPGYLKIRLGQDGIESAEAVHLSADAGREQGIGNWISEELQSVHLESS